MESREYKTSFSLQTRVASASSVTLGQVGTSDPSEARFWTQKFGLGTAGGSNTNRYSHPHSLKFKANSNAIAHQVLFGPSSLAVVSGPRVSLYSGPAFRRALTSGVGDNVTPDRNLGSGGHPALCASYQSDGRLLALGNDAGELRVVDTTTRATLCTFRTHHAVRTVSWHGKLLLSGGDDAVLSLWNLSQAATSTSSVLSLRGHADAIRCALVWQPTQGDWKELAVSGSYDHTVRLWNIQDADNSLEERCLAVMSHGAPVEDVLLMPGADSSHWLLSAGGTIVKVWNPLAGTCVFTLQTHHSKAITSMVAMRRTENDDSSWRILTAGLDSLVRIHTWNAQQGELRYIHGVKLSDPLTSLAANEQGTRLAFGTTTGHVLVRQRASGKTLAKRKREPRAGTYAYFTRGMNIPAHEGDYVATQEQKRKKLRSFDLALKQFRYGDALDDALYSRQPQAVVAVLEELGKRRGLTIALSNRDEETLEPILSFMVRYISRPQYSSLLIGVAHKLCDVYGSVAGQSETIDELFQKLKMQVSNECRIQQNLLRVVGQLDALMTLDEVNQE